MAKVIVLNDAQFEAYKNVMSLIERAGGEAVVMSDSMFEALEEQGFSQRKIEKVANRHSPDARFNIECVVSAMESEFIDHLVDVYGE